jgi:hypothetical protein
MITVACLGGVGAVAFCDGEGLPRSSDGCLRGVDLPVIRRTYASAALRPLALALALALLGGCNSPSNDAGARGSASVSMGSDPGRAGFEELPLPDDGKLGADPGELARELFDVREPMEGRYSESSELLYDSPGGQVLLFTQMELMDDAVRGIRHRLELAPEDGAWRLVWAGRQVLCRPGRGHEDWGVEPCL